MSSCICTGFHSRAATMPLAEKVPRSGLELYGRARPTLAMLPRGNWIRHTWYDFPALLDGGLDLRRRRCVRPLRRGAASPSTA